MDRSEKKIKTLFLQAKQKSSSRSRTDCPEDQILVSYMDSFLENHEQEKIEQHLLECSDCLELVICCEEAHLEEDFVGLPEVPIAWQEKAKALFSKHVKTDHGGLFDLVLSFAKESIKVLSDPGNMIMPYEAAPQLLRGTIDKETIDLVKFCKTFSGLKAEVIVEKCGKTHFNMKMMTIDVSSGKAVRALRLSLIRQNRELASIITENGSGYFSHLKFGEYQVKVIQKGEDIGQISLRIDG